MFNFILLRELSEIYCKVNLHHNLTNSFQVIGNLYPKSAKLNLNGKGHRNLSISRERRNTYSYQFASISDR